MSNVQTPATYFTAPLLDQTVQEIDVEPYRVCRRLFYLS